MGGGDSDYLPGWTLPIPVELAEAYAPVLRLHSDEAFRPKPVEVMLDNAVLKRRVPSGRDPILSEAPTVAALLQDTDPSLYLTYRPGTSLGHLERQYREVVYARLVADGEFLFLQYHFFYAYNDWVNKHEGDWEMIQVALPRGALDGERSGWPTPLYVTYSQHARGTSRAWSEVEVCDRTHPVVYVGRGSHANYYRLRSHFMLVGWERTGGVETTYDLELVQPGDSSGRRGWLAFGGRWGSCEPRGLLHDDGPVGPRLKLMWRQPLLWSKGRLADTGRPVSLLWALRDPWILRGGRIPLPRGEESPS